MKSEFIRLSCAPGFPIFHLIFFICLWIYADTIPMKVLSGITTALLLIILILTLKRTYWIAFAVSLLFVFTVLGYREKMKVLKTLLWGGGFTAVLIAVYVSLFHIPHDVSFYMEKTTQRVEGINRKVPSVTNRLREYNDALRAISHNPWGYGLGTEIKAYSTRKHRVVPKHTIHNFYLFYSLQIGVIGVFLYLAIFLLFFREALKIHNLLRDRWMKGINLGFLAASLSLLLCGFSTLFNNSIYPSIGMGAVFGIGKILRDRSQLSGRYLSTTH